MRLFAYKFFEQAHSLLTYINGQSKLKDICHFLQKQILVQYLSIKRYFGTWTNLYGIILKELS